eukprot:s2231_g9.t1
MRIFVNNVDGFLAGALCADLAKLTSDIVGTKKTGRDELIPPSVRRVVSRAMASPKSPNRLAVPLTPEMVDIQGASDRAEMLVDKGHVLGSGANGQVWLVRSRHNNRAFAAKTYRLAGISELKCKEIETEVEILLTVDHPNLARMVDAYETKDPICSTCLGIVHRDVKLENWLYEKKGGQDLKLIDFGLSKFWRPDKSMEMRVGTLDYMAPEVLHRNYTSKCDLWSLGVIAYTLLVGSFPFSGRDGDNAMLQRIAAGRFATERDAWKNASPSAKDSSSVLGFQEAKVEARRRPDADQALQHPWISKRESVARSYVSKDSSRDEVINYSDFLAAMMSKRISIHDDLLHDAFARFDTDNSGYITLPKLKMLLGDSLSESELKQVMREAEARREEPQVASF